jgi:hypothetical protein
LIFGRQTTNVSPNFGEGRKAADKLPENAAETLRSADNAYVRNDFASGDAGTKIVYALVDAAIALAP